MHARRSTITLGLLAAFVAAADSGCDRTPPPAPTTQNKTVPAKRRRVPFDEALVYVVGAGSASSQALENPPEAYGFAQSVQIGHQFQRDALQGGSLVEGTRGWSIRDGVYRLNVSSGGGSLDPALRVDKYEAAENEVVCQLDASMDKKWRFGERGFDNDKPIRLLGDQGNEFPAIGYFYVDADQVAVRYTPGTPLAGLADLPEPLSRSSNGQRVKLVFRVTKGAVVTGLVIGDKVAIRWQPKFKVDADQTPR